MQFRERADEADEACKMPDQDVEALKSSGYLCLSVPSSYGGAGCSLRDCVAAQVELAQGSASTALVAAMTVHLFGHARETKPWNDHIFDRFCHQAVAGALFNEICAEPQGSLAHGALPQTVAVIREDRVQITGQKTWCTGGHHLSHLLVDVLLEGEVIVVLVEGSTPRITWLDTWRNALGLRASNSHDLVFEETIVPIGNIIRKYSLSGTKLPNVWFPSLIAATYLGAAISARDCLIEYTLQRTPTALGRAIATLPHIQRQIGEIDVLLQAATVYLDHVAKQWQGEEQHRGQQYAECIAAKTFIADVANEVTDKALRIAGGIGMTRNISLERHLRDVRACHIHPPSGDRALQIVGSAAVERLNQSVV